MPIANLILALFTLLEPGYIGIRPAEITDATRREYTLAADVRTGLVLTTVWKNTPAARAGLRAGDVLTSFDEKPVTTIASLQALVAKLGAGEKVTYVARRGSGTIAGLLVLGKRPVAVREVAPGGAPNDADLEKRMARLQERIAKAHALAAAKQKKPAKPTSWVGYMEREERALAKAESAQKVERIIWHKARLALLREMGRGQVGGASRSTASKRVRAMEKRMEMILERLEILEVSAEKTRK